MYVNTSNSMRHFLTVGKVVHSALPARLLLADTNAYMYILTHCEGGNPVSAPGVGCNVPLVAVDCVDSLSVAGG